MRINDEDIEGLAWALIRRGVAPDHNRLEAAIKEELDRRINKPRRPNEMFHTVERIEVHPEEMARAHRVLWRLIRTGVLEPGTHSIGPSPSYIGTRIVEGPASDPLPADPRFVESLVEAGLDEVGCHYLREAVRCLNAQAFTAATAMIGVTSEHVVSQLIDAFAASPLASPGLKGKLAKAWQIKTRWEEFEREFQPKEKQILRDAGVSDGSSKFLAAIVEAIRLDRNEAGHPSGQRFLADEVQAHLLLFRTSYLKCRDLIAYLGRNP